MSGKVPGTFPDTRAGGRSRARRVEGQAMPAASPSVRRPEARRAVAHFVQAALRELAADVASGTEVPFALDTRGRYGGPALYEYRPLYRAYVEARMDRLVRLPDYDTAVGSLADDPAVLGVAHDHAPEADTDEIALRSAVLVPLVVGVAEGAGGFDFDDRVFDGIFDRMLSETVTLPDGGTKTVSYTYFKNGNRKTVTDPAGATTQYGYDAVGNLITTILVCEAFRAKFSGSYNRHGRGR